MVTQERTRRSGGVAGAVAALPLALGLLATVTDNGPTRFSPDAAAVTTAEAVSAAAGADETPSGYLNVYFGNLHAHTGYSDGVQTPEQAFRYARERAGLDFIAVTEHNHDKAGAGRIAKNHSLYSGSGSTSLLSAARRMTEDGEFVALYGQEYSTIGAGNHVNVIDAPRVIDVPNGAFDQLVNAWLPANPDSTGGLPILLMNHPGTASSPRDKQYGRDDFGSDAEWVRRMGEVTPLMAILNGPSHKTDLGLRPTSMAQNWFNTYLNLGFKLAPTADQDNHRANWGAATTGRTAVIADDLTKPALLKAIRARHVYATEDPNLRVVCRVNGQLCGDMLATTPALGAELQIELTIYDGDEPSADYQIQVFSGHVGQDDLDQVNDVHQEGNTGQPLVIRDVFYTGGAQYVYVALNQVGEDEVDDRVWLAPVWIGGTAASPASGTGSTNFVASRNSGIYHLSVTCAAAQRIKPENRVTGEAARKGREAHADCPRSR